MLSSRHAVTTVTPVHGSANPSRLPHRLLAAIVGLALVVLMPSRAWAQTGSIAGTVTSAATGAGIASVGVWIYNSTGGFVTSTTTSATGTYTTPAVTPGTFFLRTQVPSGANYIDEAYSNVQCAPSCISTITSTTPVVVSAGGVTSGVDFALGPGGTLSGVVTSTSTGLGITQVTVSAINGSGILTRSAQTAANGSFTIVGLPTGTYYVEALAAAGLNYINEVWPNLQCAIPCTRTNGTPVSVTAGAGTPGVNFVLAPGGSITGRVSDANTGASLFNVIVQARTPSGVVLTRRLGFSNSAGNYVINGLPPGTYYVNTVLPSNLNYIAEAWNNVPCGVCNVTSTTPVNVVGTATTPSINFALAPGSTISGTVTSVATGAAISGATVSLYRSNGSLLTTRTSSASGTFSVNGLVADTYFAKALAASYDSELYSDIACPNDTCTVTAGTAIVVGSATTVSGINFTLGAASQADLVVDFGSGVGLWRLSPEGTWQAVHGLSPLGMVSADIDGTGADDLVLNFGPGIGLWAWMNHSSWQQLHGLSPSQMAAGDFNGDGTDDLVFVFSGFGIWRLSSNVWTQLHGLAATALAVGQLDGTGGADLIVDFPSFGLWVLANGSSWSQLHGGHAQTMVTADLDGSGQDEVIISFAGAGLWIFRNNASWSQLHGLNPTAIAAGRIDANSQRDLVMDFGQLGLWTYRNDTTFAPLHFLTGQGLLLADRDGNGLDEIVVDFGAYGLWQFHSATGWSQLHGLSPEDFARGRLH